MSAAPKGREKRSGVGPSDDPRRGFTLLEIVVALVILAVGALGLAATTLTVVRRSLIADLKMERAVARRSVVEALHSRPFASIDTGADTVGSYIVQWSILEERNRIKELAVVTVGPAPQGDDPTASVSIDPRAADTITYRILDR